MAGNLFAFLAIYEELYSINQIKFQPKKEEKMETKRTHLNVVPMANDDEVYVTSDIAKQLREKGFDKNCRSRFYQQPSGNIEVYNTLVGENFNRSELRNTWSRPTHQMVMKWLREKYNIHIAVNLGADADNPNHVFYNPQIAIFEPHKHVTYLGEFGEDEFDANEQACEAAIVYCLTHLI